MSTSLSLSDILSSALVAVQVVYLASLLLSVLKLQSLGEEFVGTQ